MAKRNNKTQKEVVLGISASIAAYKACEIINALKKKQINVTVVMTKDAEEFITPLTLQSLSGQKVIRSLFALADNMNPLHITLAKKCDALVIAPATMNIIGKLASGIADDALSALAFSTRAPLIIAPAMNENMYMHKTTQENISKLKKKGVHFIGPKRGHLVCGDKGIGHIADLDEIVSAVLKVL